AAEAVARAKAEAEAVARAKAEAEAVARAKAEQAEKERLAAAQDRVGNIVSEPKPPQAPEPKLPPASPSSQSAALTAYPGNYPTKPVGMVVPFAAGGPTDVLGRIMAQRMGEILGQQVVVENVGGAGGMTGSKRVADAAPDGYNFVLASVATHAQSQAMYKKPLYNTVTDFTPVALIAEVPIVLITRKDLPVNNLKEFIAYAKANQ